MFHHVTRLCSPALFVLSAAALVAPASAQTAQQIDAEIRLLDSDNAPLPADYVTIRDHNGFVVSAAPDASGGFFIQNTGRKLTLEFAPKGLKNRSIDLMLEPAPKVYISMIVDPRTGQVKEIRQKPYFGNTRPDSKIRRPGGGSVGFVVPPTNDSCATPLPIAAGATAFNTTEATTDGPANGCGSGSQIHNDIWFDYTAPANGTLTISTCGTAAYDTALAIHSGVGCPPAAPLACNDDFAGCAGFTSTASTPVVSGQHYLLRVGGFGASSRGTGTLNVSFAGAGLPNDECAGAVDVPCNTSATVDSTTATTAGSDPAFSCRFGGPGQGFNSVWFKFVAGGTGVTLDTSASVVSDTMLALYDGTCGALVELACDDDSGTGLRSLINYNFLTPGNTYFVQVAGFGASNFGSITLDVDCATGPSGGDTCETAIDVACGSSASVDNSGFTTDPLDPIYSCSFGGPAQGVGTAWFKFVATDTSARIDTNLSLAPDTLLAVYSGTCGAFTEIACDDDSGIGLLSEVCVNGLTIGETYYIQASSFSAFDTGEITVTVECPCPAPPANDDCEDAEALALPASVTFDNSLATDDIGVPCGVFSGPFRNVWYSVAGTGTTLTATTCNAGTAVTDTKISVFCGDCGVLVCVAGNDDDCAAGGPIFSSTVSWCSQLGANYLISVGNFSATTTPGDIQLDVFDSFSSCVADVVCLDQGACCLTDGSCVVTTADDCAAQGGIYQGNDTACSSNAIADGSFEAGAFGGFWTESSTNFGTPLCDGGSCGFGGGTGPHSGSWWAWFGGIGTFEAGSVSQAVVIPASATTLDFWLEIPVSSGNGVDFLRVRIDGNTEFTVLEDDVTYAGTGYNLVSLPLGAYADGGVHTVLFDSVQTGAGGAITNFFVDDVSISTVSTNCVPPEDCFVLDFESDDSGAGMVHGTKVDTEFDGGANYPVTITGSANPSGDNTAAILNSSTGPASQDPDLLVGSGNILILQTDTNQTQCGAGIYCTHNDDEDGGTLSFAFNVPTTPGSIDLIDIDASDLPGSVVLTDVNGFTRTYSVPASWTGDLVIDGPPGMGTLDLTTLANQPGYASTVTAVEDPGFDPDAVVQIDVNLGGSGGVDNLTWCQDA